MALLTFKMLSWAAAVAGRHDTRIVVLTPREKAAENDSAIIYMPMGPSEMLIFSSFI